MAEMTSEHQKKIDKLYQWFNNTTSNVLGILVILGISMLIKPLLAMLGFDMADCSWYPILCGVYKYTAIILGIIGIIFFCVAALLSIWATDDKREQDKADMKEILQEIKAEEESKPKRTIFKPEEIKIPLKGLTPQQVAVVHDILHHIPEQNGHLKTSELIQILRALAGQGDLDDSNLPQVIAWVEYVTDKKVDERNLKYDYESKYSDKGVSKWGDIIRDKFDKIEIS